MQFLKRVGRWLTAIYLYDLSYLVCAGIEFSIPKHYHGPWTFSTVTALAFYVCASTFLLPLLFIYAAWPGGFWPDFSHKINFGKKTAHPG